MPESVYRTRPINFRNKSYKIAYLMCIFKSVYITNIGHIRQSCYRSDSRNCHKTLNFLISLCLFIDFLAKQLNLFFYQDKSLYQSFSFFLFVSFEKRKNNQSRSEFLP